MTSMPLTAYLPQDRLRALARTQPLPNHTTGAALFADISGFTPLTATLTQTLGPRRGIEELTRQINAVYEALIAEVERFGGSVIGFAGDAITCWFDEMIEDGPPPTVESSVSRSASSLRAVATAFALQTAMNQFPDLGLKVVVTTGPARRFAIGNPEDQYWDTLAGHTVSRLATAEHLANRGDIVVDEATYNAIADHVQVGEFRIEAHERFAELTDLLHPTPSHPLPALARELTPDELCPWINPAVFAREQAGQGVFLTELRPATPLFLRFTGIDFETEEAGEQLDVFLRQVQVILQRYEGTLIQLTIGDKGSYLYAAFGAPTAHEDDSRRAVKAALDLRHAAQALPFLEPVQIGITRGTMRTGAYGGTSRRTYGVLGDEVNLAARLMTLAAPGQILVSRRIHKETGHAFTFETLAPVRVKGKAEPLPIFAVLSAHSYRAMRLQEPTYALPMVGRTAELQTLAEKLTLTLQSKGQIIGIVADAGMGKSRLVAEGIRQARQMGYAGFGGACQADGVNTPYLAWKSVWAAFFEVDAAWSLPEQIQELEKKLEYFAPARLSALPLLGGLLNLDLPENDFTQNLEPKYRQSALRALLEDCLRTAARAEPILIVLEDLHWIDAVSLALLDELALSLIDSRVCFMLAFRPQQLSQLPPHLTTLANFTQLELSELSPAEATQALEAKLRQLYPAHEGTLSPVWVEQLTARAQGNPFYLEELLHYIQDQGLDPFNPADLDQIELPDSLHTLILSRIDQLTEREKTTLRVASIIGRLFRAAWLTGYYPELGEMPTVKTDLDQLAELDLTPLDTPEPELAYLFKHIITHEVTYESLPYATRARLHEQLAHYLENTYPEHLPVEVLAFHYGHSDNPQKIREYFWKAGVAAQKNFANDPALDYYSRLLPLLDDGTEQAQIHLYRGQVLALIGKSAEAEEDFQTALALSKEGTTLCADVQFALGSIYRSRSDYEPTLDWLAKAKAAYLALGDTPGVIRVLNETGMALASMHLAKRRPDAYDQAKALLTESLTLARQEGDKLRIAKALNNLGSLAGMRGDFATVHELYEESLLIQSELGDKKGVANILGNLGNIAQNQGDLPKARELYSECLKLFREIGEKRSTAMVIVNLGVTAFKQGDFASARKLCEESLDLFRGIGDKQSMAFSLYILGDVFASQGDYVSARASFEESLALGARISFNHLGKVALAQNDFVTARTSFDKNLEIYREAGDKYYTSVSLSSLGYLAFAQSDFSEARRRFEEALVLEQEMERKSNKASVSLGIGLLDLAENKPDAAPNILLSLRLYQETGTPRQRISSLIGVAGLALQNNNPHHAGQLFGAIETALQALHVVVEPELLHFHTQILTTVRDVLDESAFQTAWKEGSQWTLEEAVKSALGAA